MTSRGALSAKVTVASCLSHAAHDLAPMRPLPVSTMMGKWGFRNRKFIALMGPGFLAVIVVNWRVGQSHQLPGFSAPCGVNGKVSTILVVASVRRHWSRGEELAQDADLPVPASVLSPGAQAGPVAKHPM